VNLAVLAHEHRAFVRAVLVALMVLGVVSYFTLPTREDPEVTIREAVVRTVHPELSAERVDRLITRRVEEAARGLPELEELRSLSMPGVSLVHVVVRDRFFDLDPIWNDLRERLRGVAPELPEGTASPRLDTDFGDVAVVTAALVAEDFPMAHVRKMAEHVRGELYELAGTERVDLLGVQEERIYIEASNARLAELGIPPDAIRATLQAQNVLRPGGRIDTGGQSFLIEPTGNFESVEAIRALRLEVPGTDETIALADVAEVRRGYVDPPERKAYRDGRPAVVLATTMREGFSVLRFAEAVRERLEAVEATLPVGYRIELVTYQAEQVAQAVYGVTFNVLQTLAIVLLVVVAILGVRTGLIVGSIVPAVMLVTLALMGLAGLSLQRMSLATLVIALGLLVDNGIVIAEDFKRRLEDGENRDAALAGAGRELALPLLTSTLTTILVFLPLMLAEHVAGEYTRSISIVVLLTLLVSWVLALCVTPSLCHRFLPTPKEAGTRRPRRMDRWYGTLLRTLLRHRALFLLLMGGVFAAGVAGIAAVPKKFFPDSDRAQVLVYLNMPAGVSSRTMDRHVRDFLPELDDRERFPHVEHHAAYVGFGGPRFVLTLTPMDPAPNVAFLVVDVAAPEHMDETIDALRTRLATRWPEFDARVARMFLGPSDPNLLEVQVQGPDEAVVFETTKAVEEILGGVPGAIDVRSDWENRISLIRVAVDQVQARRAGVTSADVARALEGYFSGRVASRFREEDEVFPIVSRALEEERTDLDRLRTLRIFGRGENPARSVPLVQVADVRLENRWSRIHREQMQPAATVEARNLRLTAEDTVPRIDAALRELEGSLPPGHRIRYDGVIEQSREAQAALSANVPLCLGLVVLLLIFQFRSYRRPLLVVATIPLLLAGAALGLHVLRADFGFMETLGLYALAGILVNNAIVLIDRIDLERDGREDDGEAVVAAAQRRLRPILMTTVTTILGLLPLIVFRDALFHGMAAVMAFGLLFGTLMTLGVVPVLYALLFRVRTG